MYNAGGQHHLKLGKEKCTRLRRKRIKRQQVGKYCINLRKCGKECFTT